VRWRATRHNGTCQTHGSFKNYENYAHKTPSITCAHNSICRDKSSCVYLSSPYSKNISVPFRRKSPAYPPPSCPTEGVQLFKDKLGLPHGFNGLVFAECPSAPWVSCPDWTEQKRTLVATSLVTQAGELMPTVPICAGLPNLTFILRNCWLDALGTGRGRL
jgi:hypothetical protein